MICARASPGLANNATRSSVDGTRPDTKPVVGLFVMNARTRASPSSLGGSSPDRLLIGGNRRGGGDKGECSVFKFSFSLFGRAVVCVGSVARRS